MEEISYPQIQLREQLRAENVFGMFKTTNVDPSATPIKNPKNWFDQIVIYKSGGIYRIYIYDTTNHTWGYAALT